MLFILKLVIIKKTESVLQLIVPNLLDNKKFNHNLIM